MRMLLLRGYINQVKIIILETCCYIDGDGLYVKILVVEASSLKRHGQLVVL